MNKLLLAILLLLVGNWTILNAGPNDTQLEEAIVKAVFTTWLNNSTIVDVNYSEVYIIVQTYDDDYIRKVMTLYAMPDYPPTGTYGGTLH